MLGKVGNDPRADAEPARNDMLPCLRLLQVVEDRK